MQKWQINICLLKVSKNFGGKLDFDIYNKQN